MALFSEWKKKAPSRAATDLVKDWGRKYPEAQSLSDEALGDLMRRIAALQPSQ